MSILKELGFFITGRGDEWPELEAAITRRRREQGRQRQEKKRQQAEEQVKQAALLAKKREEVAERTAWTKQAEIVARKWHKPIKELLTRVASETIRDGRMPRTGYSFEESIDVSEKGSSVYWSVTTTKTRLRDGFEPIVRDVFTYGVRLSVKENLFSVTCCSSYLPMFCNFPTTEEDLRKVLAQAYEYGPQERWKSLSPPSQFEGPDFSGPG